MAGLFAACSGFGPSEGDGNPRRRDEGELELPSHAHSRLKKTTSVASLASLHSSTTTLTSERHSSSECFMQFLDDEEEDYLSPSQLSFHLSPPMRRVERYTNNLFLEDAWRNTESAPRKERSSSNDYGHFVDIRDSFDPRLYLRLDVDADVYAVPPGQDVSKIIIRTHRLKMKGKLGSR